MTTPTDHSDTSRLAVILGKDLEVVMSAVTRTSVEEVRLEDGDVVIQVVRGVGGVAQTATVALRGAEVAGAVGEVGHFPKDAAAETGLTEIRSPSVGFFHRARSEGGPNLATDDAPVAIGAPIGVIETLGMAGEVVSPVAGRLELRIQDGQAVDYGLVVAVVHPA
ncbi:MAG: acetyl-CoA carboxylase biotin carboxyl carrier protein [Chloroflexota bacterium]